jgi:hypothetical protein
MSDSELVNLFTEAKRKRNTLNASMHTNSHTMIAKQRAAAEVAKINEQLLSKGIKNSTGIPLEEQSLPQLKYSLIKAEKKRDILNNSNQTNSHTMIAKNNAVAEVNKIEALIKSKSGFFSRFNPFSRGGHTKRTRRTKRNRRTRRK